MLEAEADRLEKGVLPEVLSDEAIGAMNPERIEALVDNILQILARLTEEAAELERDEREFRWVGFSDYRTVKIRKTRALQNLRTYQEYFHRLRRRWRQLDGREP